MILYVISHNRAVTSRNPTKVESLGKRNASKRRGERRRFLKIRFRFPGSPEKKKKKHITPICLSSHSYTHVYRCIVVTCATLRVLSFSNRILRYRFHLCLLSDIEKEKKKQKMKKEKKERIFASSKEGKTKGRREKISRCLARVHSSRREDAASPFSSEQRPFIGRERENEQRKSNYTGRTLAVLLLETFFKDIPPEVPSIPARAW